jgi:hypothetical protein
MLQPPRVAQIGEDAAAAGGEVLLAADRRRVFLSHVEALDQRLGRIGCDLAFLLVGHRVDFGLRRFGINEAINTQTAS